MYSSESGATFNGSGKGSGGSGYPRPVREERLETIPVSVVIPCYRCADTIHRAVASVAAQTLRPGEVILVDDGNDSATRRILRNVCRAFPMLPIRLISLPRNMGPGHARNMGWERAQGDYVAFLDADDAWHPRKMAVHYRFMKTHPLVMFSGHRSVIISDGGNPAELPERFKIRRISFLRLLISNRFPMRSVMLKRDIPFRFSPDRRYSEDYLLWLTITAQGRPGFLLDIPLAHAFKADYGVSGLSARMWEMEKSELEIYLHFHAKKTLGFFTLYGLIGFSLLKYARRRLHAVLLSKRS